MPLLRILFPSLLALFLAFSPAIAGEQTSASASHTVRVRWVADGDTFLTTTGETVRLQGIDAPEKGRKKGPDQYYAREARKALMELVEGREVSLSLGQQPRDRFGRLLAQVFLPDGTLVNEILVRRGYAYYYPHADHTPALAARLLAAQHAAMDNNAGFWPVVLSLPGAGKPWPGNRRSRRFHAPDCPEAAGISPANRIEFPTLQDAFHAGFAPSRECTSWPLATEIRSK